jgi:hypothetical protein
MALRNLGWSMYNCSIVGVGVLQAKQSLEFMALES